ncbi:MAG: hypothetical protein WBP29_02570 [Candidatus Zixiibacteriota bacterium]
MLSTAILGFVVWIVPKLCSHMVDDQKHPSPLKVITTLARNSNQLSALGFSIMLVLGHFTIVPFLSPYMLSNVGFSESDLT